MAEQETRLVLEVGLSEALARRLEGLFTALTPSQHTHLLPLFCVIPDSPTACSASRQVCDRHGTGRL